MSRLTTANIQVLAAMCTPIASQDDLVKYLNVPNRELMLAALKEEQQRIHAESAKEAALSIIALSKKVEESKAYHVEEIRRYRTHIEQLKAKLDKMDNLLAFGSETGNYIPLVIAIEGPNVVAGLNVKHDLTFVPEDWKPSAGTAASSKKPSQRRA